MIKIPLTQDEVQQRLKGILEAAGVSCLITGMITAAFPDGERCHYTALDFESDGLSHQRG